LEYSGGRMKALGWISAAVFYLVLRGFGEDFFSFLFGFAAVS
jgi:hypothetical protein